jgi:2-dehydropantoate 2-reductase
MNSVALKHVYFIGLGAIGAKYASMLHDYDPNLVSVIVDKHRLNRYEEQGFVVNGKPYRFNYITAENCVQKADLILIAVKSTQLKQALVDIAPFIGEKTIVLSLLNGVNTAEVIGNEIGMQHMLYSIIYMDAVRDKNIITYQSKGRFLFGERCNLSHSERVKSVANLLEAAQIVYEIPEDMSLALWQKYLINIVVNQLSFIVQSGYQLFKDNEYILKLTQLIGEEAIAVANAYNVNLTLQDIEALKKTMLKIDGKATPSMYQDRLAGRKSEVDIFSGELIKLAEAKGVSVPFNTFIYNLITAIEFETLDRR